MKLVEVEVLIHHNSVSVPHHRADALAIRKATAVLLGKGMIARYLGVEDGYTTTPKGRVFLQQVRELSDPVVKEVWVGGDGKIINMPEGE